MSKDLKNTQKRWDTFAAAALTGLLAANRSGLAYAIKEARAVADAMMFDFKKESDDE